MPAARTAARDAPRTPSHRAQPAQSGVDSPVTASDFVTNELRAAILSGELPLGSRLDQQLLAERMGVSTIPVREGLRRLEANGLVRIHPRRGAFVAELSHVELVEIKQIREVLEELATKLATPRVGGERLDRLVELNARMAKMTGPDHADAWGDVNRDWHFTLYEAADSPMLLVMITHLWDRSSLYRHVYAGSPEHRQQSVNEHEQVVEHVRAGRAAAAGKVIRHHIFGASARSLMRDGRPR